MKLYREIDGEVQECNCDKEQVKDMVKGGWSDRDPTSDIDDGDGDSSGDSDLTDDELIAKRDAGEDLSLAEKVRLSELED